MSELVGLMSGLVKEKESLGGVIRTVRRPREIVPTNLSVETVRDMVGVGKLDDFQALSSTTGGDIDVLTLR